LEQASADARPRKDMLATICAKNGRYSKGIARLAWTIAPGESLPYETNATLYIEKAGSFDKTSQSWDTIRQASPVWLQVTLETWAVNIEPRVDPKNLEFGKMLRRRWQQVGELQLEHLTSEPMLLDFSSFTLNNTARKRSSESRQR